MPRRKTDPVIPPSPEEAARAALPAFEGRPVLRATVKITKAGDGLSDALQIAPTAWHHSDEVWFVLRGQVRNVNHRPYDTLGDELIREHVIDTVEIAVVDRDEVHELLRDRVDKVRKAQEEARGVQRLEDAAKKEVEDREALAGAGLDTSGGEDDWDADGSV